VGGTAEGLRSLTLARLKAHAARVFTRQRLTLGVAGGVSGTEDPSVVALERALLGEGGLPAGGPPPPAVAPPRLPDTRMLVVKKQAAATAISLGFPVRIHRRHPDFHAMMLAVSALGEHRQFGGRLFERLRGKRGLNYGDYAYLEHFVQDGYSTFGLPNVGRQEQTFTIWIRPVEHRNRLFALRAALFELERFVKEGITQEELDRTRGFLAGYTLLWEQTMTRRLGYALDDVYYGTREHLGALRRKLPGLTLAEVNAAIRRHLDPSRVRIAVVTRDAESLVEDVLKERPSPITYATPPTDRAQIAEDRTIERWRLGLDRKHVRVLPARELFEK
jgi:zinc protease